MIRSLFSASTIISIAFHIVVLHSILNNNWYKIKNSTINNKKNHNKIKVVFKNVKKKPTNTIINQETKTIPIQQNIAKKIPVKQKEIVRKPELKKSDNSKIEQKKPNKTKPRDQGKPLQKKLEETNSNNKKISSTNDTQKSADTMKNITENNANENSVFSDIIKIKQNKTDFDQGSVVEGSDVDLIKAHISDKWYSFIQKNRIDNSINVTTLIKININGSIEEIKDLKPHRSLDTTELQKYNYKKNKIISMLREIQVINGLDKKNYNKWQHVEINFKPGY